MQMQCIFSRNNFTENQKGGGHCDGTKSTFQYSKGKFCFSYRTLTFLPYAVHLVRGAITTSGKMPNSPNGTGNRSSIFSERDGQWSPVGKTRGGGLGPKKSPLCLANK